MTMDRPIHVCFVSLQARGAFVQGAGDKVGGAESQVYHLATWLAGRDDTSVGVIVEDSGQPPREVVQEVTLHRLSQPPEGQTGPGRLRRLVGSALALRGKVRELEADLDLQRTAGAETGICEHAAQGIGHPVLYMMASDSELDPLWRTARRPSAWLFRRGLRRADRILVQHEAQRKALRRYFTLESTVLPNVYPFPREPAVSPHGRVIWVGRCVDYKQPIQFLELARRLPTAAFTMVAPPVDYDRELAARVAREAGLLANLTFIPGATREELEGLYGRSGVLVNTSTFEGMPNTFLEAAAHGLAIVSLAYDPGGVLGGEGAGQFAAGDPGRLAEIVGRLAADTAHREDWARRAQRVLRARHDVARVGPQLFEIIRELVASHG
jgi:glycosyltransferase involved in cell wall biosynthesis